MSATKNGRKYNSENLKAGQKVYYTDPQGRGTFSGTFVENVVIEDADWTGRITRQRMAVVQPAAHLQEEVEFVAFESLWLKK